MDQLTFRQRIFIREYILSKGNASKAATMAYNVKNRNVAGVIGSENLRKPKMMRIVKQIIEDNNYSDLFIATRLRLITENTDSSKEMLDAFSLYLRLTGR